VNDGVPYGTKSIEYSDYGKPKYIYRVLRKCVNKRNVIRVAKLTATRHTTCRCSKVVHPDQSYYIYQIKLCQRELIKVSNVHYDILPVGIKYSMHDCMIHAG